MVSESSGEPLQLIVDEWNIVCLGSEQTCAEKRATLKRDAAELTLSNGYVLPGLTGLTRGLGMREIAMLDSTGDGEVAGQKISDPESVNYAKYGAWLDGRTFARARLGGVTRAVSPLLADASGFVTGVSVEVLTSGKKGITDGGIVQGDVTLHLNLGEATKSSEGSVRNGIKNLRNMLGDGKGKHNETVYGRVATGELPLVVNCNNKVSSFFLFKMCFLMTSRLSMTCCSLCSSKRITLRRGLWFWVARRPHM